MKIDKYLLTKKDIENIKTREQIDNEVQERVKIEYNKALNECVQKYNVDYNEICKSDNLKYTLIRKSRCSNENGLATIFGIMLFFTPTVALYLRYINNKFIFETNEILILLAMYLASTLTIWLSIKEAIERIKIKNNFKSLGIGDDL